MADQKLTERTELTTSTNDAYIHVVDGGLSYKQKKSNFLKEDRAAYVDLTSTQTITGAKTFNTGIQIGQFTPLDTGIRVINGTNGNAIIVSSISSGDGIIVAQSGTGRLFVGNNGSSDTFEVNKDGDIVAKSIDIGGTSQQEMLADGTTRTKPLIYTALISQSSTSAPTVTVLENTLSSSIVWSRTSIGQYVGTLAGAFTLNKTWCSITGTGNVEINFTLSRSSNDTLNLATISSGTLSDGLLSSASIEIRVYPID